VIAAGYKCITVHPSDTYMAFLPLAHVLELVVENVILMAGGSLGYGNPRTLTTSAMKNCYGDIKELRPTLMAGVPEVWERIRKGAFEKLKKQPKIVQGAFNGAFSIKKALHPYLGLRIPIIDTMFSALRSETGGRLRIMLSGGAPVAADTQTFLRMCFGCNCIQGYGLTETCGVVSLQLPDDYEPGVVGGPVPAAEIKLLDIPDMGYTHLDSPNPRGELLARGPGITVGYYKNEEQTKEVYKDGWFSTGDIAEILPNGSLKIVDRKKNLVKLSHGEYIALEKLESVYKHSEFVENICCYGDSSKEFAIALIVPHKNHLESWAEQNGIHENDFQALCDNDKVKDMVLKSLQELGKKSRLASFEILQGLYLSAEEWTAENDMLTAAFKLKRRNIVKKYQEQIDAMYKS